MEKELFQRADGLLQRPVSRRTLLKIGIGAMGVIGLDARAGSTAATIIKARLGHGQANTTPIHRASVKFADLVKEKSKGRLEITVFPASQLGNTTEMPEAVRLGTLEFHVAGNANIEGIAALTGVVNLPGLFRDNDHAYRAIDTFLAKEVYEKTLLPIGIRPFGYVSNEFRQVTNSKRPIKTLADMKGLKIRVPKSKVFVDTVAAMGASPTPIDFAEVFGALQQGVIDGQENPLLIIYNSKLYEVQPHLALTNHMWDLWTFHVNERFFQGLDPELQKIVLDSGKEAAAWGRDLSTKETGETLDKLKVAGMKVTEVDKQEVQNAVKVVWDTWTGRMGQEGKTLIQRIADFK